MPKFSGFVNTSYTNAYAIVHAAQLIGLEVTTLDKNPIFPITCSEEIENEGWQFFTEEASLRAALESEKKEGYLPTEFPIELLDDKWEFVDWLSMQKLLPKGLLQWSIESTSEAIYPCVIKAKHSWIGDVKLPRGWVCTSLSELEKCIANLEFQNLDKKYFFIQEWLGGTDCRVISVCGFHDSHDNKRNLTAIVERIASHHVGLSCSAAIETIDDKWGLIEDTERILNTLKYKGPYELEYIVRNERVAVLELNPRFWMQHAIFIPSGNGLIKRYLGLESQLDRAMHQLGPTVWIDGLYLTRSLILMKLNFLRILVKHSYKSKKKIIIWPSIPMALYIWARIYFKKFFKKYI